MVFDFVDDMDDGHVDGCVGDDSADGIGDVDAVDVVDNRADEYCDDGTHRAACIRDL